MQNAVKVSPVTAKVEPIRVVFPTTFSLTSEEHATVSAAIREVYVKRGLPADQVQFDSWTSIVNEVLTAEEESFLTKVDEPLALDNAAHRS